MNADKLLKKVQKRSKTTKNITSKRNFNKAEKAISFHTSDGLLIVLKKKTTTYIHGLATISVLYGVVEILGYVIKKTHHPINVYSPRGASYLYLKNISEINNGKEKSQIRNLISQSEKYEDDILNLEIDLESSIILCTKIEEKSINFIEKHMSQQIFPKFEDPSLVRCTFEPKGDQIYIDHKWNGIIDQINESTKLMLCGGKGVGKSTLLRYSINKLLMRFNKVRIIDLDPGQSEFTIPGCISIVLIDKPLFGVNFTHLRKTERSILTSVNAGDDVKKYILRIQQLVKDCLEEKIPTLINYMGYVDGLGLNIACTVMATVCPTVVLQLSSNICQKNFKKELNPKTVGRYSKTLIAQTGYDLNYNLIQIESMCDEVNYWKLQPRQIREMCILSYFGKMVESNRNSILSEDIGLYEIDLGSIKIVNLDGTEIPAATINANLVALGTLRTDNGYIFDSLGWGIVRGVDLELSRLVLLTPETIEVLQNVEYLVFTDVSLPPSIYMTCDGITGSIPYVNKGGLMNLGQIPKRSYISVKK